jgi:glucose-1-phosphate cytidylyltransferase
MTAVEPTARFGTFDTDGNRITAFHEKEDNKDKINGGFFVLEPEVFDYIDGDMTYFEQAPLKNLARDGKLFCYNYDGFWKCMDSMKDKKDLEELWQSGKAPWKVWDVQSNSNPDGGAESNSQNRKKGNSDGKNCNWI